MFSSCFEFFTSFVFCESTYISQQSPILCQVLTVQHPLEESRDSLAFATEPVLASLANLLGNGTHNTPSSLKPYELHDIEIKHGLLQVAMIYDERSKRVEFF